jgi:hypothetical protein
MIVLNNCIIKYIGEYMPVICRFYGILIKMYFNDHLPPHFHAIYNEFNGIFDLNTLEMIEGDLPNKAIKLIKEWAQNYKPDLTRMWDTKEFINLPGLE